MARIITCLVYDISLQIDSQICIKHETKLRWNKINFSEYIFWRAKVFFFRVYGKSIQKTILSYEIELQKICELQLQLRACKGNSETKEKLNWIVHKSRRRQFLWENVVRIDISCMWSNKQNSVLYFLEYQRNPLENSCLENENFDEI